MQKTRCLLVCNTMAQSSTDPYNQKAPPKKPPPPLRSCAKPQPPTILSKKSPPITQSATDPYDPKAPPKKPPPPSRSCVKPQPPTIPSKQAPPAVVKKAPPPIIVVVYQIQVPPAGKAPPPILHGTQMQAHPAVVKRAPPPRSNHKPKSSPNVTVADENAQPALPLRALPLKAPSHQAALKAPPPKLTSQTNIKTSN